MDGLKRYELVELVIPAGSTGTRFPYPDIPQLRDDPTQDIIVCSLETFAADSMPLSPAGNAVVTQAQLLNTFLTLYIEGEESVRQLPMVRLNVIFQALATGNLQSVFELTRLEYLKIDWNKSYYQAATPYGTILLPNTQFSIMLGVRYKKLPPGTWSMLQQNKTKGW
jgi:hypothetical protein